jgi:hypothetical protein
MNSNKEHEMNKLHTISNLHFENDLLILNIDGETRKYPVNHISHILQNASDTERNNFEISPSGYGIHWPLLDEDLSIDGLLKYSQTTELSQHR